MPKWVRVRDTQTGHTFDVDARVLPHRRGVEPVNDPERWPDIEGPRAVPRPPKPFVGKDGKARSSDTSTDEVTQVIYPDGVDAATVLAELDPASDAERSSEQAAEQENTGPAQYKISAPDNGGEAFIPRSRASRARRSDAPNTPATPPADSSEETQQ